MDDQSGNDHAGTTPRATIDEDIERKLLEAVNGRYAEMRDDNFIDPDRILVYDEETDTIAECHIEVLHDEYPTNGPGHRWSSTDLSDAIWVKQLAVRQSIQATETTDQDPNATAFCEGVVLVIPADRRVPYRVKVITAIIADEMPTG